MPSKWQLDSLNGRTETLLSEVERVSDKHHRDAIARRLYGAIRRAVKDRTAYLKRTREAAATADALRIPFELVQEQLAALIDLFNKCDRLDSARIPFEILDALAVTATSLLGEECEIVVQLSPAYNYEIVSMRRVFADEAWSKHWEAAQGKNDRATTVLLMVFPSYEVSSVLLHAASAHELAHELIHKNEDVFANGLDRARTLIVERDEELRNYPEPPPDAEKGIEPENAFELQLMRWAHEIFSDLVAVHLVGPPFLLALERLSVARNTVMKLDTHPPLYLRRKLIKEYLGTYLTHIANDKVWGPRLSEEPDSTTLTGAWYTKLRLSCEEAAKQFAPFVSSLRSPLMSKNLNDEVAAIMEHLDHLIPPSAALDVSDVAQQFWLLVYGAWRFVMDEGAFGGFCDRYGWTDDKARADKAVNNLLLHSLQALELRARVDIQAIAKHQGEEQSNAD
jgi:hypothetical protein